ncbi:hypothetical protein FDP41_004248 [Naegleria fowleri]|uniref:Uncharacterized protein n=1 Tax=Naegleria fowleri TaxID=5763 RepID=A0A6A5BGG3_NAEFO|nr:uncharacterized protein FDP41_004248 [Naegleria fowleri]KAF0976953.1 hypothetical protein FDP41_004248 [Naegleria fowleri]
MSSKHHLHYASQPKIQPFHQTFVFVEGTLESEDTATTTCKIFSIYEISNLNDIQRREVFRVWESDWLRNYCNSIITTKKNNENSSGPGRGMRALCHVGYSIQEGYTCNEEAIITNWNLKEDMSKSIQHYTHNSNNDAVGFVNGRALFMPSSGTYILPQIEKKTQW